MANSNTNKKQNPKVRGFNPDAVKIEHIKKVLLLYGDDKPGIQIRLKVFQNILQSEGYTVEIFDNTEAALDYLRVGNLFSSDVHIIVNDASDALKTSKESKALLDELLYLLPQQSENSHLIFALPYNNKDTIQITKFKEELKNMDGTLRSVTIPEQTYLSKWTQNYAASAGYDYSSRTIANLLEVTDNNPDKIADAIDSLGNGLNGVSKPELVQMIKSSKKSSYGTIQQAIIDKNVALLKDIRDEYPEGSAGDRTFINKTRYIVLDILSAITDNSKGMISYINDKRRSNPNFPQGIAFKVRRQGLQSGGYERYSRLYLALNQAYSASIGFNQKTPFNILDLLIIFGE